MASKNALWPAAASAAVGDYPISPSDAVGTGLANYTITYADGSTVSTTTLAASQNGETSGGASTPNRGTSRCRLSATAKMSLF